MYMHASVSLSVTGDVVVGQISCRIFISIKFCKIQVLIFQKKQSGVLKAFNSVFGKKLASFLELSPKL